MCVQMCVQVCVQGCVQSCVQRDLRAEGSGLGLAAEAERSGHDWRLGRRRLLRDLARAGGRGAVGCSARVTFGFGAIYMHLSANPRDLPERAGVRGYGVHEDLHEDLCEIYVSNSARCAGDLGSPRRIYVACGEHPAARARKSSVDSHVAD